MKSPSPLHLPPSRYLPLLRGKADLILAATVAVTVAGGLLLTSGCDGADPAAAQATSEATSEAQAALAVSTAPLERVEVPQTVEVTGTLEAEARTTIAAEVEGRVREVAVDLGDRVTPGQVLARINPTDYELTVAQREAALGEALASLGLTELPGADFDVTRVATVERNRLRARNAESRLNRARSLFEQTPPLMSEQEFADIQTEAEVAQQDYEVALLEAQAALAAARTRARELAIARQDLQDTVIRAPEGVDAASSSAAAERLYAISRRHIEIGQFVRDGDALFELVIDNPLRFRGAVPQQFAADVAVGQRVQLTIAGAAEAVRGTVTRIDPTVDVASRSFLIEVTVDNPDRRLRPGSFARASVQVGTRPAYRVPTVAFVSFAGTNKIFTIAEGRAVEHRVSVLERGEGLLILTGDFGEAQQVITSNVGQLTDGTPVKAEPAETGGAPTTRS